MIPKIHLQTPDITSGNIEKIKALFPEVITETQDENGAIVQGVDFELLKQKLAKDIVDGSDERYRLDWPGKRRSILKANTPINKTLVPDRESSVDFENTQNVYIEGDNFEVLKILQESYLGKIKMIYIDPPYNTGKDFVYKDNFKVSREEYEEELGVEDEEGGRLFKNTDTNGRFHSDWLSMMYERLVVARDLLTDDGVIFMSIDDNEVHNLRKIADEIFGEENFVEYLFVLNNLKGNYNTDYFANVGEYLLVYAKSKENFTVQDISIVDEEEKEEWEIDEKGFWKKGRNLKATGENAPREKRPTMFFPIYVSKEKLTISLEKDDVHNIEVFPITNGSEMCWNWSKEQFKNNLDEVLVFFSSNDVINIHKKQRPEILDVVSKKPKNLFYHPSYSNTVSAKRLGDLFGFRAFDYSKSTYFIKHLLEIGTGKSSENLILDFFSGSATTADAIMELNVEDDGNRKFIMVQLPEQTDEKSEAYKAGYKTIPEIGRERIRRAGKKILEEHAEKLAERETSLDIGFRAYKVADTIYNDVHKHPDDITQSSLLELADNIKSDKSPEDILTAVMLSLGLTLDLPIKSETIGNNTVFNVADGALMACFDTNIDMSLVEAIAKQKPLRAVFRDASFKDDQDRINTETTFKQLSPETRVNVI